jgi:hypothetical protein
MSFFGRTGTPVIYNHHTYVTDSIPLQNVGLGSYTRNSMAIFGKQRPNPRVATLTNTPEMNEYFGNQLDNVRSKLLGDQATLAIMTYDKANNQYYLKQDAEIWVTPSGNSATSLKDFQAKFDSWQKGFLTTPADVWKLEYTWSAIQNSVSGCINYSVPYSILNCGTVTGVVRLYFHSAGKVKSSERNVALKGSPMIADIPRRATQGQYSLGASQQAPMGVYVGPGGGGLNNPENTVAGQLRTSYDPATGKFESGTQQALFRLLTDIDGAQLVDLPDDVDNTDIESFYTGPFSSTPTFGSGMPMSIENNNTFMFGPNALGCATGPKEKTILVNRTPRQYTRGEIVIASLINGEWIPIGFVPGSAVTKKFEVQWSQIQKFIVDAKSFFRNNVDGRKITPEQYTDSVRFRFYASLPNISNAASLTASGNDLTRTAILNLIPFNVSEYTIGDDGKVVLPYTSINSVPGYNDNVSLVPSTGYLQFFDADVIKGTSLGGNNATNILNKTNIKHTPLDYPEDNEILGSTVTGSWGMYFPDGYTAASVAKLKSYANGINILSEFSSQTSEAGGNSNIIIYRNATLDLSITENGFFDLSDNYLYHFPAQFALNASGNQSLYAPLLWFKQSQGGVYINNLLNYMKDPLKGDYLRLAGGGDVYKLKPINSTLVQFTPLSLELALCGTTIPDTLKSLPPINGGLSKLNATLTSRGSTKDSFGKAWERLGITQPYTLPFPLDPEGVKGYIGFGDNCINSVSKAVEKPTRNDLAIDGGPGVLPIFGNATERSNVVGIIGARSTINLLNGGQIELRTNNNFGLNTWGQVTGGGGRVEVTLLGSLGGWSQDNRGELKVNANVQWGSSSQEGDITAFGTTALYCQIYDHCPNTIYDPRFFAPLQFNGEKLGLNGKSIDVDMPAKKSSTNVVSILPLGTVVGKDYQKNNISTCMFAKNPIRQNMLLSGGGFSYFRRVLGANNTNGSTGYEIKAAGSGYAVDDIVKFGGTYPAIYKVTAVDGNGGITAITLGTDVEKTPGETYGIDAYGEFNLSNGNPFEKDPIQASFETGNISAKIYLNGGKVIEKVSRDTLNSYDRTLLTPYDNNGGGDGRGYVKSSRNNSFALNKNLNGKYDIFFFFVNDILNYPETDVALTYSSYAAAQYVNVEISAK